MLNKIDEGGHPCLVPDLRGKAFSISPLTVMLVVGLSQMVFILFRYISSMPSLCRVLTTKDVEFCEMLPLQQLK